MEEIMASDRRFKAYLLFLAVAAVGLVWIVGQGEATPREPIRIVQTQDQTTGDPEITTERPKRETLYRNIKLLDGIALRVAQSYMEDVDPQELTRAGIDGMLDILDPFSVLMELKYYNRLMETTHGRYEGLGMSIDMRDDTITIVAPMEGTPAMRVGLQAGDKVVKIDGESTDGMSTEEASKKMRGPAGTTVILTIARVGIPEPLEFTVERAVIELKSVPYYGMADQEKKIGYLRLSKFSETTGEELRSALAELNENDLNGLIFDLRGNGGGLLEQAVETASLFLDKDRLVVYTQGKDPRSQKKYFSKGDPMFHKKPLVILVDGATASASEIVSGAVQDWDRGLIVGNTTFGKGLVQQIFSLPENDDIRLKLTTAKYYVPSGRCIQKPHISKKHPELDADDELIETEPEETYKTRAGRQVYGGGGIVPDVNVERNPYAPVEVNLLRKSMYFNFAVEYTSKNPDVPGDFVVTDAILDDFREYLERREFTYKTATEVEIDKIKELLEEDSTKQDIYGSYLENLKDLVDREKEAEYEQARKNIQRSLRGAILNNAYGERGWYEGVILRDDPYVHKAVEILTDRAEYKTILAADHVRAAASD
jgi:carboxyl-terminal processing protease